MYKTNYLTSAPLMSSGCVMHIEFTARQNWVFTILCHLAIAFDPTGFDHSKCYNTLLCASIIETFSCKSKFIPSTISINLENKTAFSATMSISP